MEEIKSALRDAWTIVFLDGRNEHGAHVLPMPGGTIEQNDGEYCLDELGEKILAKAESLGYAPHDCVVVRWRYELIEDSGPGYYEMVEPCDPLLTELLCGTPAEQRLERSQ